VCVFTDGKGYCVKLIFKRYHDRNIDLCLLTGKCDCVNEIFIWSHDMFVAVCLLTIPVTVLR